MKKHDLANPARKPQAKRLRRHQKPYLKSFIRVLVGFVKGHPWCPQRVFAFVVCARDLLNPAVCARDLPNPAFYEKAYYYSIEGDRLTIVLTASSFKASG